MKDAVNGWTVLLIVVLVVLTKLFTWVDTQQAIPAVAAQIGANQQLVVQVNEVLGQLEPRLASMETRLDALERGKAASPTD